MALILSTMYSKVKENDHISMFLLQISTLVRKVRDLHRCGLYLDLHSTIFHMCLLYTRNIDNNEIYGKIPMYTF